MKYLPRKMTFLLIVALSSGFTFAKSNHLRQPKRNLSDTSGISLLKISITDTLNRQTLKFSIDDTLSIEALRAAPADSFSSSTFTALKGITTFRGGPFRDRASAGTIEKRPVSLKIKWTFNTHPSGEWGGGAGWTGQPSVVQWPDSIRAVMNLYAQFLTQSGFAEVIFGSLDGNIYFLDLDSGKPSRPAINIKNPIKGSVSVDPRGYPLLYCGQGISLNKEFRFRIFSLVDQKILYYINGYDAYAFRGWAAFDGAALINPKNDRMYLGGENGVFYALKLNSKFEQTTRTMSIAPDILKYHYKMKEGHQQGIENSVAAYHDKIYFADNDGYIQCLDLQTFKPQWILHNHDDTDASLMIEAQDSIPYLYTGSEVDKQGDKGSAFLKKLNGNTGSTVWERKFDCLTVRGEHPVNGGMLSTPILGKMKSNDRVIFSLSRYGGMNKGLLVALDKMTGETIYEVKLNNYTWSSPVDIYDTEGNMYIFLADSRGYVMLFDGADGSMIYQEKIADIFEASPVVFDNKIIIPSRPSKVFCLEID
jgi:outer membrane protein assembly factor BamB